ncbi:hypothetical protein J4458_04145 [Candidatus Woesearchaeota archaeon]|nr:hypothetical protein [Candidatus Woesearchaeota archaeon]
MAEEGPYEIMPYKEIVELRKQVQELKSKGSDDNSNPLSQSVGKLAEQMNSLMGLFKTAAEDMRLEEKDEHFVAKKIEPLIDKLDSIIEQNKIIAEGIVAVADMIKESMERAREPKPFLRPEPRAEFPAFEQQEYPKFSDLGPKPMAPMPRHTLPKPMPTIQIPSAPMAPMPQSPLFEEPLPFDETKKKGLFGRFKK